MSEEGRFYRVQVSPRLGFQLQLPSLNNASCLLEKRFGDAGATTGFMLFGQSIIRALNILVILLIAYSYYEPSSIGIKSYRTLHNLNH